MEHVGKFQVIVIVVRQCAVPAIQHELVLLRYRYGLHAHVLRAGQSQIDG